MVQDSTGRAPGDDTGMKTLLLLPFAIVLVVLPLMLLDAWVFVLCWRWFVVPLGAPEITYVTAMGFRLIAALLRNGTHIKAEYQDDPLKQIGKEILGTLTALAIAVVLHRWFQ